MYAVSALFLQALRSPHTAPVRVEVWSGGTKVIPDLPVAGGAVIVDGTTGGVRRKIDVRTASGSPRSLWDTLAPIGTELVPYRGLRFPDGAIEWVPLGVFVIDAQSMGYGVDGQIVLSAPDRWARVQRARFLQPTTTQGLAAAEALRLAAAAVPVATSNRVTSTVSTRLRVWDRDRDQAVNELAGAAGAEVFFDVDGTLLARDVPRLTNATVWTVDAGASGVLVDASRARDRSRTYNAVVVASEATDGSAPFAPQLVADTDSTSPTWVGGPFGHVPAFYSSPLITTAAQAVAAGQAILARTAGLAAQLRLESVVNPALDAGDVVAVVLPDGRVERHLVDTVTVPLDVGTAQQVTTRSTRPEGDVPGAA